MCKPSTAAARRVTRMAASNERAQAVDSDIADRRERAEAAAELARLEATPRDQLTAHEALYLFSRMVAAFGDDALWAGYGFGLRVRSAGR
ncbi:hypothetical protein [Parafrankia discariae]|uniref:hypothetical protein n=1 Tax=Parafrankia discariae TaxID=365528 RepID=UPI00035DB660|nr:hypothetical protein [Parafrankia discariae]